MPNAWSDKDERQYEHIKKGELQRGRGTKRAKAIAAATVNKRRSEEGRTERAASRKRAGSRKMSASRTRTRERAA